MIPFVIVGVVCCAFGLLVGSLRTKEAENAGYQRGLLEAVADIRAHAEQVEVTHGYTLRRAADGLAMRARYGKGPWAPRG